MRPSTDSFCGMRKELEGGKGGRGEGGKGEERGGKGGRGGRGEGEEGGGRGGERGGFFIFVKPSMEGVRVFSYQDKLRRTNYQESLQLMF